MAILDSKFLNGLGFKITFYWVAICKIYGDDILIGMHFIVAVELYNLVFAYCIYILIIEIFKGHFIGFFCNFKKN